MKTDLKVRKVPEEVFSVMGLNDKFNYLWNPDPVSSLVGLGSSYLMEFFEFYGDKIGDYYDEFMTDPIFREERYPWFIAQEKSHAAAHRKMSVIMTKERIPLSREKHHPRVYDFMYVAYKQFAEPILEGIEQDKAAGKTSDSPFFKEALKSVAVFETKVCMSAFAFFDNLIDNGRLEYVMGISQNLGVLYLLGYHYAEEMEHCSVSIEAYEGIYNEIVWTKEMIEEHIHNSDTLSQQLIAATLHVAKMLGVDVTVKQITNCLAYQASMRNSRNYVREGFNAREAEIQPRIKYLVETWDNHWEPMLLERIKQQVDQANLAAS